MYACDASLWTATCCWTQHLQPWSSLQLPHGKKVRQQSKTPIERMLAGEEKTARAREAVDAANAQEAQEKKLRRESEAGDSKKLSEASPSGLSRQLSSEVNTAAQLATSNDAMCLVHAGCLMHPLRIVNTAISCRALTPYQSGLACRV